MATRCSIGMLLSNGSIQYIYCHWDGYPENNGVLLQKHYSSPSKINELISFGNLSSLGSNIGAKHDFSGDYPSDWCNYYGRDRGDEDHGPYVASSEDDFTVDKVAIGGCEYMYLYKNDRWYVSSYETSERMVELSTILNMKI